MKSVVALTIAGSDSGGGAGIQADLKTFAFHRVHGASVITCITAQNTATVTAVMAVSPDMVKAQFDTVTADMEVRALKTGMLLNQGIIETVAQCLQGWHNNNIVVDPVMVSRGGDQLIDDEAVASLRNLLIPQGLLVTPNIFEAQLLSGVTINGIDDMKRSAEIIYNLGVKNVLVKGGGLSGTLKGADVFFDGDRFTLLQRPPVVTKNTHGTGCTLGAAITAHLALGYDLINAIAYAKDYVTMALEYALDVGEGAGPVGHFCSILPYVS
ncbi:MAG: bifunctional hydroxymethylpyrimidine kinase/phosphomethylpyrimidine kinase [Cyanobacterium sp. T60_A2020_053]|nr:bifunctional hydroxymethylpyrimidine kinase/phosphomethylpyrimidine kinase [Cyanobacterium sp. T60_A2020_053]